MYSDERIKFCLKTGNSHIKRRIEKKNIT